MVQWLGLHAFTAEGLGSIPGQGTKILQAVQCRQKKKERERHTCKGQKDMGKGHGASMPPLSTTVPKSPCVHQPRTSLKLPFWILW